MVLCGALYKNMKNYFPEQNKNYTYLQTNRSDDLGSLWSTMNLDFQSNLGTMRVAPRLKVNTATATVAQLNNAPVAFEYFGSKFWTVASQRIFQGGETPEVAFTVDTSTAFKTTYSSAQSDLELFNGQLFSTTTDEIWSLDAATGGTWTQRGGANSLPGGGNHMMTYFKKFNRLYVINSDDLVYSMSTGYALASSGDYTLNLATNQQYAMLCIKASSNSIWIGAGAQLNAQARGKIYQWDGISAQPTNEYTIDANSCVAIVIDDDIPYAMDSNGVLLKFTGSSFEEIGRLPQSNLDSAVIYGNEGFIHPNGLIATKDHTILALINNLNTNSAGTISENLPSGVWEFSEEFGFTHKHSLSYNPVANSTITDYGQNRITRAGALIEANVPSTTAGRNGTLMLGANYYTDATTITSGIFINDSNNTVQKKGYFVTSWFNSSEIEDKWSRLWATYRRLLAANDSIVFKYRLNEEEPVETTITWVNTTSFTTTTNITAYGPTATGFNGTVGGEVEVTQGTGSGSCVHITNISENGGTYTVTLDTAVTGVTTGTAKARFQKWIRLYPTQELDQVKSWSQFQIGQNNTRIQIKGCLTFTGNDEFHKFVLTSNEDIKATL